MAVATTTQNRLAGKRITINVVKGVKPEQSTFRRLATGAPVEGIVTGAFDAVITEV